jgi:hypothetical protein
MLGGGDPPSGDSVPSSSRYEANMPLKICNAAKLEIPIPLNVWTTAPPENRI